MKKNILISDYNETYEETAKFDEFVDPKRKVETYFSLVKSCPGKNVLEIGCAKGTLAIKLAKDGYKVTAVDIAKNYIYKAYINAKTEGVKINFRIIDIQKPCRMRETFDIIVMTEVLEHLRSPSIALENVWKLLKNNGFLIISTPNQGTIGKLVRNLFKKDFFEGLHLNCYDFSQLYYTLRLHGFTTVKLYSCEEIDIPIINRISFIRPLSLLMGKRFPTLSKQLIIKAKKSKPLDLNKFILNDWKYH